MVKDGEVLIVDEFTGVSCLAGGFRQAPPAIEPKKGLLCGRNRTCTTITVQNFFRMYKKLAGMTGTCH